MMKKPGLVIGIAAIIVGLPLLCAVAVAAAFPSFSQKVIGAVSQHRHMTFRYPNPGETSLLCYGANRNSRQCTFPTVVVDVDITSGEYAVRRGRKIIAACRSKALAENLRELTRNAQVCNISMRCAAQCSSFRKTYIHAVEGPTFIQLDNMEVFPRPDTAMCQRDRYYCEDQDIGLCDQNTQGQLLAYLQSWGNSELDAPPGANDAACNVYDEAQFRGRFSSQRDNRRKSSLQPYTCTIGWLPAPQSTQFQYLNYAATKLDCSTNCLQKRTFSTPGSTCKWVSPEGMEEIIRAPVMPPAPASPQGRCDIYTPASASSGTVMHSGGPNNLHYDHLSEFACSNLCGQTWHVFETPGAACGWAPPQGREVLITRPMHSSVCGMRFPPSYKSSVVPNYPVPTGDSGVTRDMCVVMCTEANIFSIPGANCAWTSSEGNTEPITHPFK